MSRVYLVWRLPFNFKANPFALQSNYTRKGFTGHQQLDGVGIIHMGGRIYDAELGRFLQADPFVNNRTHSQALNRYTYVENNPLSYTDPSGYFLKKLFKKVGSALNKLRKELVWKPIKKRLQAIARIKWLSSAISIVLNFIPGCQGWCSMIFNAAMTMANGGTIGQILKGAAIAAIVPDVGGALTGALGGSIAAQAIGSALQGGILSVANGGKFADGAKGGLIGFAMVKGMQWGANKIASWAQGNKEIADPVVTAKSSSKARDTGASADDVKKMEDTRALASEINEEMELGLDMEDVKIVFAGKKALGGHDGGVDGKGTIGLSNKLKFGTVRFKEVLAEELVHRRQYQAGYFEGLKPNSLLRYQLEHGAGRLVEHYYETTRDFRRQTNCWGDLANGRRNSFNC